MGFSEMVFIGLIAYLIFGPKKSVELARTVGQHVNNFKRAAGDLQAQITSELPLNEIANPVDHLRQTIIGTLTPNLGVPEIDRATQKAAEEPERDYLAERAAAAEAAAAAEKATEANATAEVQTAAQPQIADVAPVTERIQ